MPITYPTHAERLDTPASAAVSQVIGDYIEKLQVETAELRQANADGHELIEVQKGEIARLQREFDMQSAPLGLARAAIAARDARIADLFSILGRALSLADRERRRGNTYRRRALTLVADIRSALADEHDQAIYNAASADVWRAKDDAANGRRNDVLAWPGYWSNCLPAGAIADLRSILGILDKEEDQS